MTHELHSNCLRGFVPGLETAVRYFEIIFLVRSQFKINFGQMEWLWLLERSLASKIGLLQWQKIHEFPECYLVEILATAI